MQIDKNMLDQLLNLDDTTLSRTISLLADAAGIDKKSANAAIADLRLVRSSLSNATDSDIEKAISMLGEERARTVMGMFGKNHG